MKKLEVIKYFGGVGKTANALGILQSAVSQWGDNVPKLRAFEIERITNGVLKAEFIPPSKNLEI